MSIGIIGAGQIGSAFPLARNGIAATISNSRGPETLQDLATELTPHIEAARSKRRLELTSSLSQFRGRSFPRHWSAFPTGLVAS